MCSLSDYTLNSKVGNLPEKFEKRGIRGALGYACRSWYDHLVGMKGQATDIALTIGLQGKRGAVGKVRGTDL